MAPPQSDEQLGAEPAMEGLTIPPDQNDEPTMDGYTVPPHDHSVDQLIGNLPPMQDTTFIPYAAVDSSLRAMAGQAEGFGRHAIGGLHGDVYHVTTLAGWH